MSGISATNSSMIRVNMSRGRIMGESKT
jgi:hypothetical protein